MTPNTPFSRSPPSLCPHGMEAFSEPQSWSSHIHSVALPVLCSICTGIWSDLTLCFQLLQDKLRISTCNILYSVYTEVTEKMSLFLFQNREEIHTGCPFPRQNNMTNFSSMAPQLVTKVKTKLLLPIPKMCL